MDLIVLTFIILADEMPALLFTDVVRTGHLAAMAVGFGTMVTTDMNMLRRATETITAEQLNTLHMTHQLMLAAIVLAWVSGLVLVAIRTGLDPAAFTPKLMMKLIVVTILSATALLIQQMAIPVLHRMCGQTILDARFDDKIRMAICGGLSVASWGSALLLGAAAITQAAGWSVLIPLIGGIYAVAMIVMLRNAVHLHNRTMADRVCTARIAA